MGKNKEQQWEYERFQFINQLNYKSLSVNYIDNIVYLSPCPQAPLKQHAFLTNFEVDKKNVKAICTQGRMRWEIENEGFNSQKNAGLGRTHKYARKDLNKSKNYYLLLQIGHMISQLVEKLLSFKVLLRQSGKTDKSLFEDTFSDLKSPISFLEVYRPWYNTKQLRYTFSFCC